MFYSIGVEALPLHRRRRKSAKNNEEKEEVLFEQ